MNCSLLILTILISISLAFPGSFTWTKLEPDTEKFQQPNQKGTWNSVQNNKQQLRRQESYIAVGGGAPQKQREHFFVLFKNLPNILTNKRHFKSDH